MHRSTDKIIHFLDTHLLKIAVIFLLIFIPLYPKLPLTKVPHTWVYIRLEDIFIFLTYLIWGFQLVRRKIDIKTPLTLPLIIYWIAGLSSLIITLVFTARHLANFFPNVAIFHYLRRIEYLGLFLVAFSTIKSKKDLIHYFIAILVTLIGVICYGFGQRFLGFPAFLTMNEEFAKGIPLYLAPTSRLTSTFGGHYDLAAYLVFLISFLVGSWFGIKKIIVRVFLFIIILFSVILLLMTASRISFAVYLIAVSLSLWLSKRQLLIPFVLVGSILLMFGVSTMSERLFKTIRVRQVVYDVETGKAIGTLEQAPDGSVTDMDKIYVPITTETQESLPVGSGFINIPSKITDQEATSIATIKKPVPRSLKMSTISAEIATISGSFLIKKALVYDISITTRIQGEWPRAIEAFKRNIIFGSGYSSIGLSNDNDYLRSLAETGLLGFSSFILVLLTIVFFLKNSSRDENDMFTRSVGIGLIAGLLGIMINAIFIDVFEASKVAYTVWLTSGIVVGTISLNYKDRVDYKKEFISILRSIIDFLQSNIITLLFLGFIIFLGLFSSRTIYFTGDDFTWLRWAAEAKGKEDIIKYFTEASGFFYRPLAKLMYFGMYNIFWLEPEGYHILSFVIHAINTFLVYLLARKFIKSKLISYFMAILFSILAVHSESLFWIPASFELIGLLFGLMSILFFINNLKFVGYISFFLAVLGHESMVIVPLIFVAYDYIIQKRFLIKPYAISLGIIIFYAFIRVQTHAHWLHGDYSYNITSLPVNFIGNALAYGFGIILGPSVLTFFENARNILKDQKIIISIFVGVMTFLSVLLVRKFVKSIKGEFAFFASSFIISLLPFLGLGNTSERYAYFGSVWAILILSFLFKTIYEDTKSRKLVLVLGVITFLLLSIFQIHELKKSESDWHKAGKITYTTLASLRNNFLNLPPKSTFFIAYLPIRYGRAWVFPVGFEDGLALTLGDNAPQVKKVESINQGLESQKVIKNSYVFTFENFEIKEVR
jgi:hypothetical protein